MGVDRFPVLRARQQADDKTIMVDKIRAQIKRLSHPVRWIAVLVLGSAFILAGLAMLVLPGPGIVFIGIGFAVLAIEFTWAEVVLHKASNHGKRILLRLRSKTTILIRGSTPPANEVEQGGSDDRS